MSKSAVEENNQSSPIKFKDIGLVSGNFIGEYTVDGKTITTSMPEAITSDGLGFFSVAEMRTTNDCLQLKKAGVAVRDIKNHFHETNLSWLYENTNGGYVKKQTTQTIIRHLKGIIAALEKGIDSEEEFFVKENGGVSIPGPRICYPNPKGAEIKAEPGGRFDDKNLERILDALEER